MSGEWTPERLRREMAARRMSQEALAHKTGRTERMVRYWLKGDYTPDLDSQARLDDLFDPPAGEREHDGGEGVDRRQVFAGVLLVSAGAATGGRAEQGVAVGDALYRVYSTESPQALIEHARLNAALRPSPDAYAFVGWLARMTDARGGVRKWFTDARDLAADAGDDRARAQALLGLSTAYEGTRPGLEMVEEARGLAVGADPWTRLHVELVAAGEHARARQTARCHGALWRAERLLDRADPADGDGFHSPAGRYAGWNVAFVASERAKCEAILGDGARTLEAVAEADGLGGPGHPRAVTLAILSRGRAYALLDEPEAAAEALSQAWTRARDTGHELAATRTLEARRVLDRRSGHPAVRALDELILHS